MINKYKVGNIYKYQCEDEVVVFKVTKIEHLKCMEDNSIGSRINYVTLCSQDSTEIPGRSYSFDIGSLFDMRSIPYTKLGRLIYG